MRQHIDTTRLFPSGGWQCSALVLDANPAGNPWGAPFFHRMTFMGYTRREAVDLFLDSLRRDGLTIVSDDD